MDNGILIHMVGVIHMPLISSYTFMPGTALSAVQRQGLTSGLKLCLDASDIESYGGSGQVWNDTSGNAYHFNRGTGSSSDGADPTFNGTAGGQSSAEFWSFDGGDYFTLGQANPTWVHNLHKNNALFTVAMWVRISTFGSSIGPGLMGTYKGDGTPSWDIHVTTARKLGLECIRNASAFTIQVASTATMTANAWTFLAVSVDEATGAGTFQINGTQESFTSTYSSPPTGNAGVTLKLGDYGDGVEPMTSGARMAQVWAWEGVALSTTQLSDLFTVTRSKFGV